MNSLLHNLFRTVAIALTLYATAAPGRTLTPDEMRARVEAAQELLRISEASQETIREELEALRAAGAEPPEVIERYEAYLTRISEMVERQRKILEEMEALYKRVAPPVEPEPRVDEVDPSLVPVLPETTDPAGKLEQAFNTSLEEFDAVLMNKMDELAKDMEEMSEETSEKSGDLAAAIEAAQKRLEQQGARGSPSENQQEPSGGGQGAEGEGGEGDGEEAAGGAAEAEKTGDASETGTPPGSRGDRAETGETGKSGSVPGDPGGEAAPADPQSGQSGGAGQGGMAGGGDSERPAGRPEYQTDDDIIARQLREAAEKETDPVLKEKLWEEYRKYKESQSR